MALKWTVIGSGGGSNGAWGWFQWGRGPRAIGTGPGQQKNRKRPLVDPPPGASLGPGMEPNFRFSQFLSELFGSRVGDRMCTLKTYQKAT